MTITVPIISKTQPSLPVLVSGTGDNMMTAKRAAIYFARVMMKEILDPIVLEGREGAEALRRAVNQHARSLVNAGRLNGRSSLRTAPERPTARFYRN